MTALAPTSGRHGARIGRCRMALALAGLLLATLVVASAGLMPEPVVAQVLPPGSDALTVAGFGSAVAPADEATIQLLVGPGDRAFGVSRREDRGGGRIAVSESATAVEATAPGPRRRRAGDAPTAAGATPVAAANVGPTEAVLTPVLEALAANGIARTAIAIQFGSLATEPRGPRAGTARLDFVVSAPTVAVLADLARNLSDAASSAGLVVELFAVGYRVADCPALEDAAQRAAVADARARAERLARNLGVGLGDVVGGSDFGPLGGIGEACAGPIGFAYESDFGGLGVTLPPFDAVAPAEVEARSQVTVSYAVAAPAMP